MNGDLLQRSMDKHEQLLGHFKKLSVSARALSDENKRLRKEKAELLAALKACVRVFEYEMEVPESMRMLDSKSFAVRDARTAVLKAEGQSS